MVQWRAAHWPPAQLTQYSNLPIYYGSYEQVFQFHAGLAAVLSIVGDQVVNQGGHKPRWLRIPKIEFGVRRLNLVATTGHASRRFTSTRKLQDRCGLFEPDQVAAMEDALVENPEHALVAHQVIQDTRVYLFTSHDRAPRRVRFMQTGLVLAVEEGFVVQDHSRAHRTQRNDAYSDPIAVNDEWTVYLRPIIEKAGKTNKPSGEPDA
jgi:hypothetical protein